MPGLAHAAPRRPCGPRRPLGPVTPASWPNLHPGTVMAGIAALPWHRLASPETATSVRRPDSGSVRALPSAIRFPGCRSCKVVAPRRPARGPPPSAWSARPPLITASEAPGRDTGGMDDRRVGAAFRAVRIRRGLRAARRCAAEPACRRRPCPGSSADTWTHWLCGRPGRSEPFAGHPRRRHQLVGARATWIDCSTPGTRHSTTRSRRMFRRCVADWVLRPRPRSRSMASAASSTSWPGIRAAARC